jgi:hypothetical protein
VSPEAVEKSTKGVNVSRGMAMTNMTRNGDKTISKKIVEAFPTTRIPVAKVKKKGKQNTNEVN